MKNPAINFKGFLVSQNPSRSARKLENWKKWLINTIRCKSFWNGQLGNPLIDDYYDNKGTHEYWWNHGLIADSTYEALTEACSNDTFLFPKGKCNSALSRAYKEFGDIDPYNIYSGPCREVASIGNNSKLPLVSKLASPSLLCLSIHSNVSRNSAMDFQREWWVHREVHEKVHESSRSAEGPPCQCDSPSLFMGALQVWIHDELIFFIFLPLWSGFFHGYLVCVWFDSSIVRRNWTDSPKSMLPVFKLLISAGIRIWVFR